MKLIEATTRIALRNILLTTDFSAVAATAHTVVANAHCPVLTVRLRQEGCRQGLLYVAGVRGGLRLRAVASPSPEKAKC